jgi:hypothetical protein
MAYDAAVQIPVVLFGAFDRHNFGDLLLPHIAAALMPGQRLVFAGLAQRNLRSHGGHEVVPLSRLALDSTDQPCVLVHVGGEILTCEAWQAAVMLLPPEQAQPTISYLQTRPRERLVWVRSMLGTSALAPYTVSRRQHPGLVRVIYNGVGGAGLDQVDDGLRAEVLANLREADAVSVRDMQTRSHLASAGISARLIPDPAVMVAELFGAKIRERARDGKVAQALRTFPHGYIAVQFSADFGDDDRLTQIAKQMDRIAALQGLGVVLFRAGAAPWHDDLAGLGQVATLLRPGSAQLFTSIDLWDICALIAHSRAYCGSSLHGRIVATAFALPRVNLRPPASKGHSGKQAAYAATWDDAGLPAEVEPRDIAEAIYTALAVEPEGLRHQARRLARLYRKGFMAMCPGLT